MGIKNAYYFFENKWYNFVEKTGLYKLTDKIDKFMPSFILFILLIITLIAGLFLALPAIRGQNDVAIYFSVYDDEHNAVPRAPIFLTTDYGTENLITDDLGRAGPVYLEKGIEFSVDINYSGSNFENFTYDYYASVDEDISIYLDTIVQAKSQTNYNFSLVESINGRNINSNGTIELRCTNFGATSPGTKPIVAGKVNVDVDVDCQLYAQSISVIGYETIYGVTITPQTKILELPRLSDNFSGPITHSLLVTVNNESGTPLTGIKAELLQNNVVVLGKTCITSSGTCTITGIEGGSYVLRATDQRTNAEYGQITSTVFISENTSRVITMTRNIAGYILVKVKRTNNQAVSGATVILKEVDREIARHTSDINGLASLAVYDLTKQYRIIVDKEGFLIASQGNVVASPSRPNNPTVTITLQAVTPQTAATLNLRAINSETGRGFSHAQVVLYNGDTGFLTDYQPRITNIDGNVTFVVSSGNYYAKAFRGASVGISEEFEFNVRDATTAQTIAIPMEITKGNILVKAVNKDGEPVPNATILLFDKFNSRTPIWGGDLANINGTFEITGIVSDQEVYVVVSDIISGLGTTQSEFVYVRADKTTELTVTLYPKIPSSQKPIIEFLGFFNDSGNRLNGFLRSGAEYKAKFLLLIPSDRQQNNLDRFEEVGAVIRTGSSNTPYMENDSIFIKRMVLPNAEVQKFTQFSTRLGYDGILDEDTRTDGDAKWAKVIFNPINNRNYATAYTIVADLKIKESAAYGEKIDIHYLGFGYNDRGVYETDPADTTTNRIIEYMTYKTESFNVGEEQACSDDFCFVLNITNLDEDIRKDVVDSYSAKPQQRYKLRFGLINNNKNRIHPFNSRFEIKNIDKGIDFNSIKITQPNSSITNVSLLPNTYEYRINTLQFNPHSTISGEIVFVPILKGDRQIQLSFISDQNVVFIRPITIHVLSDKTFKITVSPEVIPSGKNFNLEVEVKDAQTNIEPDRQVTVSIKDRFKRDLISNVLVGALGRASITNIPGQESGHKIFVYVQAPEYETAVSEIEVTDNIFKVTPTRIGVSLNINTKPDDNTKFTIENLTENALVIESIRFIGDEAKLDSLDILRINNSLAGYYDLEIPGKIKDRTTYDNKKEIEVKFFTNPRVQTIKEVNNLSSKLLIKLRDKHNRQYSWEMELPVTITVGFDGLMDNANCISLSEGFWEATVIDKFVDNQFTLRNNCGVNQRPVPLNGGLSAKVEFEGNPLGRFNLTVGNRLVELSHGYFKQIYDTIDSEKTYTVNLRYEPVGRYTGEIKGKIIFRSLNATTGGNQELLTEYKFTLRVVSLGDCYVLSKKVLSALETGEPDTFVIENKGCGSEITYRLSCDGCNGLVISPRENIKVAATGSSEEIKVMSIGATPGIYLLNVFSKVSGARGTERNVGKLRVEVRPNTQCLDLDRYEFDLFRYEYSENTGQKVTAKSFDTANIINRCYGQEVKIEGKVKSSDRWWLALLNGVRDGVITGGISGIIKKIMPEPKENEEKCSADNECMSKRCVDGTCRAKLEYGGPCGKNEDCVSNYCNKADDSNNVFICRKPK